VAASPLESVTIREQVLPRLEDAGWSNEVWSREYPIAPGGLSVIDGRVRRGAPLRADIATSGGNGRCIREPSEWPPSP
jgi:hypothetical protein